MSQQKEKRYFDAHPVVFWASAAIIVAVVAVASIWQEGSAHVFNQTRGWIEEHFSWLYVGTMGVLLLVALWLMVSKYGRIRLGRPDEEPEFSTPAWLAMLFSAGMGIGLLFFSVAEPIYYLGDSTPPIVEREAAQAKASMQAHIEREIRKAIEADDMEQAAEIEQDMPAEIEEARKAALAQGAMRITFFHWGLHPWACYTIVGLALAYFGFRHNQPLTIRSVFYPLLGKHIHGPAGDVVDTLAVVSTMFGVATSLGLGVLQINSGLHHVTDKLGFLPVIPDGSKAVQVTLITVITLCATISVVTGVKRGIKILSNTNMLIAFGLMVFVFVFGVPQFLLNAFVENVGGYLQRLPAMTFRTDAYGDRSWITGWTIFYWGWWIAWSPFVGMFIARISRGRTVRQFVLGVLLVPTLLGFLWLTIFGNTALHMALWPEQWNGGSVDLVKAVDESMPVALFVMLEQFPYAAVVSLVATLCVILFFVTSSDSASMVIDIITAGGNPNPPVAQRVFWALSEGAVAAVLLLAGGEALGLRPLQAAAIATALPFSLVVLVMCISLAKGMHDDISEDDDPVRDPVDDI